MTPATSRILQALELKGLSPVQNGHGWKSRCPGHDDDKPSLSISDADNGGCVLKCFAGCSNLKVVAAIGLKLRDLMPDDGHGHAPASSRASTPPPPPAPKKPATVYNTSGDALAAAERWKGGKCARFWNYSNEHATPVGMALRFDLPGGGKEIVPLARDADGWIIGAMQAPRPVYQLPHVLKASPDTPIIVVEGEKTADATARLGYVATTSAGGSQAASKTDWTPLADRDVAILPDRDDAGEKYAKDVDRLAREVGARSVKVVRLADAWPDLPVGGDVADLVDAAGDDADALEKIRRRIDELIAAAPVETVDQAAGEPTADDAADELEYQPFPTASLPEPVAEFVTAGAAAIGCDPSFVALPMLSALAAAIGNTRRIGLKPGWSEPAIVWTGIVGESGTQKSPAFKLAVRTLRDLQARRLKEYAEAAAKHELDKLTYEKDVAAWKRDKDTSTDPPAPPPPPVAIRYVVSDATAESLAPILLGNPRGVLQARDELGGWLCGFDRYAAKAGADATHYLSMFNGEAIIVDRKTGTPRTIYVPSAVVSVTGGIQPGIMHRVFGVEHRESGLLARFLLAEPPRRAKTWTEARVSDVTQARIDDLFARLLDLDFLERDGEPAPVILPLTPAGKTTWTTFYNEHARELAELTGDLAAVWSKLECYAARLALIVHLVRCAAGDPDVDHGRVDELSVAAGVTLVRWFGREARRIYGRWNESDDDRDRRELVDLIRRRGGDVNGSELCRLNKDRWPDVAAAEVALQNLVSAGRGEWYAPDRPVGPGAPPVRRFRLKPVTE